jgi:hypothetical protein
MKSIFVALTGLVALAGSAAAQTPVAVVEDVQGKVTGAEFMDYVAPGKVIKLGAGGMVVLGYMKSCRRETISGIGTVVVGTEESLIHLAEVKAGKVDCDSSHSQLIDRTTGESAATVVRSIDGKTDGKPSLDVKGERYDLDLTAASAVRGKFYDLAKTGTALKPGGTYAASLGSQRAVFLVDRYAEPGATAIIGRLVRLE